MAKRWLANSQPGSAAAAYELWVAGKTTSLIRRSQSCSSPWQPPGTGPGGAGAASETATAATAAAVIATTAAPAAARAAILRRELPTASVQAASPAAAQATPAQCR